MSKFSKKIKYKLMVSLFLGVVSTAAMDSNEDFKRADVHMTRAYAALDIMNARKEEKSCKEKGQHFYWYSFGSIESYFNNTGRRDLFRELQGSDDRDLLGIAEREFNMALALNNPYAASGLRHIYQTEETKELLRKALLESIRIKREIGSDVGLSQDTMLLIGLEGISLKNMVGIQRVEELNLKIAINHYGYLADNLDTPESNGAFDALMRLQENQSTWHHIANAYFCRNNFEEGLNWVERILTTQRDQRDSFEDGAALMESVGAKEKSLGQMNMIIGRLKEISDERIPLPVRLRAARLAHKAACFAYDYDKSKPDDVELLFDTALIYTNLNIQATESRLSLDENMFAVGSLLAMIADDNPRQYMYPYALLQEKLLKEGDNLSGIIDMYRRAGEAGSGEALEKLSNSPHLLEAMGRVEALSFLLQYQQDLPLLRLSEENPAYLILLSLLSEQTNSRRREALRQRIANPLEELESHYPPAMDLKILKLGKELQRSTYLADYTKQQISNVFKAGLGTFVSIPIDDDSNRRFNDEESANKFLNCLLTGLTIRQKEIDSLVGQKSLHINRLSAYNLYNLAKDYDLINRGCEVLLGLSGLRHQLFLENFILMLEKSAEKGFLPAVTQLVDLYENGYLKKQYQKNDADEAIREERILVSPEKAAFYQGIQAILTDETLGLVEKMGRFEALVHVRE